MARKPTLLRDHRNEPGREGVENRLYHQRYRFVFHQASTKTITYPIRKGINTWRGTCVDLADLVRSQDSGLKAITGFKCTLTKGDLYLDNLRLFGEPRGETLKALNQQIDPFALSDDELTKAQTKPLTDRGAPSLCAALSCVWLKSMMNFSWRSLALQEADPSLNPAQLFLGQPTSLDMAGYLTDAEVVAIHRKYKNSAKVHAADLGFKVRMEDSKATGQEIENYSLLGFWIEAFREIGMRLERCWFPRSHANVPAPPDDAHFATRMEWMVRDAGLDKPSPEPGIGAYIGFGLKIKSVGHGLGAAFPQELGTLPGGGGVAIIALRWPLATLWHSSGSKERRMGFSSSWIPTAACITFTLASSVRSYRRG